MSEAVTRHSTLGAEPLPELLGQVARDRFTGVVRLQLASGPAEIYLSDGQAAAVELPGGVDRLADVLRATGVIDAETIRRSLAAPRPPGLRYGRLLVESGLLPATQLMSALRLQIKRRLHRLFFAEEGDFQVEPGDHGRGVEGEERALVDVRRSVLLGVRSAWSEPRFGARLSGRSHERVRLGVEPAELGPYGLNLAEQALLVPLVRGAATLDELLAAAAASPAIAAEGPAAGRALFYSLLATFALAIEGGRAGLGVPRPPQSAAPTPPTSSPSLPPRRPTSAPDVIPPERTAALWGSAATDSTPSLRVRPPNAGTQPSVRAVPRAGSDPRPPSQPSSPGVPLPASTPPSSPAAPAAGRMGAPPSTPEASPPSPPGSGPSGGPRTVTGAPAATSPRPGSPLSFGPRTITVPGVGPGVPGGGGGARAVTGPVTIGPRTVTSVPGGGAPMSRAPGPATGPGGDPPQATDEIASAITSKRAIVDDEDLFQVLGVSRESDRAAIKAAYLEAARAYHPDRLAGAGLLHLRASAEHIFRRVSEAHATLADDRRRAIYLEKLSQSPEHQAQHAEAQKILAGELALREGELALKRRDFPLALSRLGEAVKINPTEGEGLGLYAWARFMAGQATLADLHKDFETAVIKAPQCARNHYFLGMARKQKGNPEGAVSSFQRAVDLDPRHAEAASELRVLRSRMGKKR